MRSEFIIDAPQIVFLSFVTHTAIQTVEKVNEYRHTALFCHNKNPRDLNVKLSPTLCLILMKILILKMSVYLSQLNTRATLKRHWQKWSSQAKVKPSDGGTDRGNVK